VIHADRSSDAAADPLATLASLGEGLFENESWLDGCEQVQASEIPPASRSLLAHNRHMTSTLKTHYGQPVALRVLSHTEEAAIYRRKILLTLDDDNRVVEFGIVRLFLDVLPAPARNDVIARKMPLGEIFAHYDVLTRVEPRWYLRFAPDSAVVQYFVPRPPQEVYGRLGLIHCNGRPAVELLEVVPA
jgi:chorismate-pyruvate lyase